MGNIGERKEKCGGEGSGRRKAEREDLATEVLDSVEVHVIKGNITSLFLHLNSPDVTTAESSPTTLPPSVLWAPCPRDATTVRPRTTLLLTVHSGLQIHPRTHRGLRLRL